jgi:hypothetical protein
MSTEGRLTLRRLSHDHVSYVTVYDHPDFGKLDVGRIGQASGVPRDTDKWEWSIGFATLPGRLWLQGTTATLRAAEAEWRRNWITFCNARSEADWHDARVYQDRSRKKIDIYNAGQKPVSREEREALRQEMERIGPTPEWVKAILQRET